jgi:uncharacterized membrane protein
MGLKEIAFMLLAHHSRDDLSHTIKLSVKYHEIYFCARCTAIYSSLIVSALLFAYLIDLSTLQTWIRVILALAMGTPVILSWGKQTLTGRENSNRTRILTGIGGGVGLAMLFYLPTPLREGMIFGIFGIVFLILYFGKIRKYKKKARTALNEDLNLPRSNDFMAF